ncbi:16S rRNA (guanine(966)-N(2))-methyltransferase RsmD [Kiritimatiellota bacterium B12222]|nr:16S rRNA (guanine(966)-N(2))-methyltransferase RsmD [Kiritimatiellota bacterium B12222]
MKITGGRAGGIPIDVLKGNRTRPTTDRIRESVFGGLQGRLEDAVVLDLFAGSGAMGLEAASRGASKVDFVEKHNGTAKNIERNVSKLPRAGVESKMKVHCTDSYRYLKSGAVNGIDLIFVDPPYVHFEANGAYNDLLSAVDRSGALAKQGLLVIESSSRLTFPEHPAWTCIKQKNYGASTVSYWQAV